MAAQFIREIVRSLKIGDTIGREKHRANFHGREILNGRGFAGVAMLQAGASGKTKRPAAIIDLSGQALEALRRMKIDDAAILAHFAKWKCTRIDIAIDTNNKKVTPRLASEQWHAGNALCKADNIREIQETRADGRQSHTVYIGSATSTRMLRVYDKATQMEFVHAKAINGSWTRFELRSLKAAAKEAADRLRRDGTATAPSIIAGWIDFKDPKSINKQQCRRKTAAWWAETAGTKKPCSGLTRAPGQ